MRNPIFGVIMWPFAKMLQALFALCGSYGVSIILFALLIKLILLYPSAKAKRNSLQMARMNPKMQEIKKRCGNDQQKYSEEIMKLYKEQGVSPMSGCLWSFIPVPILFALYGIIRKPLSNFMWLNADQLTAVKNMVAGFGIDTSGTGAYQEIAWAKSVFEHFDAVHAAVPQVFRLDFSFLGIDLAAIPWHSVTNFSATGLTWATIGLIAIPIISGALNFFLMLLTNRVQPDMGEGNSAMNMKMMMYMMPIMSIYMGFILPASLGIYWIAQSLFALIQEWALQKFYGKRLDEEDRVREEKLRADRLRRMEAAKNQPEPVKNKNTSKDKQKRLSASGVKKEYKESTTEAGRVGGRPYARGRAFNGSHYDDIDDSRDSGGDNEK
jgi:YidC/Oxa1 family membrane protein insertase